MGDDTTTLQKLQADPPVPQSHPTDTTALLAVIDRNELIDRARTFLISPQVRNEDLVAKRRFLEEKGLTGSEIDGLLQQTPIPAPLIPPRTYPQPPPSNLPNLLFGLARIISWLAGSSAALLFIYFRYIYPRLTQSFQARLSLHNHQKELLSKFTGSLTSLKSAQAETFSVLPRPQEFKEDTKYQDCHALESILSKSEDVGSVPPISLLRCAIEELGSRKEATTSKAIFDLLESKSDWLKTEEGSAFAERLWTTLNNTPLFHHEDLDDTTIWIYTPPTPPPPPPLLSSFSSLKAALPDGPTPSNRFLYTLAALADLTGYVTGQLYAIRSPYRAPGFGGSSSLSTQEEEVRREIRALKGLVLNRRSFMPALPRSYSVPNPVITP